jgi:hypothetical protein
VLIAKMNEISRQTVIMAMQRIINSRNPGIRLDLSSERSIVNEDLFEFFFFFFVF